MVLSTGRVGSGFGLTCTWPDQIGWTKNRPTTTRTFGQTRWLESLDERVGAVGWFRILSTKRTRTQKIWRTQLHRNQNPDPIEINPNNIEIFPKKKKKPEEHREESKTQRIEITIQTYRNQITHHKTQIYETETKGKKTPN